MRNSTYSVKFLASLLLAAAFFLLLNRPGVLRPGAPALGPLLDPFTGFWHQAEPMRPSAETLELHFDALTDSVSIVMDERRVPHLFASNPNDAAFAQGYLMARDRLWQMDMVVRAISGRVSEILGESALSYDRQMRQYGMARSAQMDYEIMRNYPFDHGLALAYADGVNAYLATLRPRDYPIEFKLLGYAPQPWKPHYLNLVQKYMAMDLCFRADDLAATNALAKLGKERFDFLFPWWNPQQSPVIPDEVPWNFEPVAIESEEGSSLLGQFVPQLPIPPPDDRIGSNNWAVSGTRTQSGFPVLANDPHLGLNLPSIWYELQVHTPQFQAYGVTLPCLPGIIIGFNQDLAWGLTNVGHDVLDFFRLEWQDSSRQHYLVEGEARPVEEVQEMIYVKGRDEPVIETVRYTHWGPVIETYSGEDHADMAMRWLGHEVFENNESSSLGVFYQLMQADDYDAYAAALRSHTYPAQNFVMASRDGDIAMKVNGNLPLRRPGQGRFVMDGSRDAKAWHGYIPREHIPQVRNPERGWVSSANQHSTDPSYPYYYHAPFDDYRGRYINRVLGRDSLVSVEDVMALQNDTYSLQAEEALPVLLALLERDALTDDQAGRVGELERWSYHFRADDWRPALFDRWLSETRRLTLDEWAVWQDSIQGPVLKPQDWRLLELLADHPEDPIFDLRETPSTETAADIVTSAFQEVCPPGADPPPVWAEAKPTRLQHMGRLDAFSVPVRVGGYRQAPNAISEGHGPSWRMIVELGPELRAFGVYPGGQSGNPGSPYYAQMVDTWAKGQYYPLILMDSPADERIELTGQIHMFPRTPVQ